MIHSAPMAWRSEERAVALVDLVRRQAGIVHELRDDQVGSRRQDFLAVVVGRARGLGEIGAGVAPAPRFGQQRDGRSGEAGPEARCELFLPAVALPIRHVGAHGDTVAPGQNAQRHAVCQLREGPRQALLRDGRGLGRRFRVGVFQDGENVRVIEPGQARFEEKVGQPAFVRREFRRVWRGNVGNSLAHDDRTVGAQHDRVDA